MSICSFQNLAKYHNFLVHGIACGRLSPFLDCFLPPVDSVLLNNTGSNVQNDHVAEKREKVNLQSPLMPFDILGIALAFGDDRVLTEELLRRLGECLSVFQLTALMLALKLEVPVFSDILCLGKTFLLGAHPFVSSANEGRTLPVPAVWSFVNVEPASHEFMMCHTYLQMICCLLHFKVCNLCATVFQVISVVKNYVNMPFLLRFLASGVVG